MVPLQADALALFERHSAPLRSGNLWPSEALAVEMVHRDRREPRSDRAGSADQCAEKNHGHAESASAALLNAVAGQLPLASGGAVGTQVNTLV
jgi:hypothetical protein